MGCFSLTANLWPLGIIPYEPNLQHEFWHIIYAAIVELNTKTSLIFREKLPTDTVWIYFTCDKTKSNFASVGKRLRPSQVNVKHNVRALHELGHVVGMIHEHQRKDRDGHIEFKMENFKRLDEGPSLDVLKKFDFQYETEYDINSCMHYWCTAHCKEISWWKKLFYDNRTMVYKGKPKMKFGTPEVLSKLDIECIEKAYAKEIAKRKATTPSNNEVKKEGEEEVTVEAKVIEGVTKLVGEIKKKKYAKTNDGIIELFISEDSSVCLSFEKGVEPIRNLQVISTKHARDDAQQGPGSGYLPVCTPDGEKVNFSHGTRGKFTSVWYSNEEFHGKPIVDLKAVSEEDVNEVDLSEHQKIHFNFSTKKGKESFLYFKQQQEEKEEMALEI